MNKQSGFGIVPLIAFILIIGAAGTIGWQVWKHPASMPTQSSKTVATANTEVDSSPYYRIDDWGVKIPLGIGAVGLYMNADGFRSTALDAVNPTCKTNSLPIVRGKATDLVPGNTSQRSTTTFANTYAKSLNDSSVVHVKINDYYFVNRNQPIVSCSTTAANAQQEAQALSQIQGAVSQMVEL